MQDEDDELVEKLLEQVKQLTVKSRSGKKQVNDQLNKTKSALEASLASSAEQQEQIGTMKGKLLIAREQIEELKKTLADERQVWKEAEEQAKKGAEKQAENETEEQAKKDAEERLHKGNSNCWASVH
jgi:hypothetical protein